MENKQTNNKKEVIGQDLLDACIHCGLCLPACPTYLATGRETESPRGRIYLLNLWQQKNEPFSERMSAHLDSCCGCFSCQTACPSGVHYEAIFNKAKTQVNAIAPPWIRLPRYLAFKILLPNDYLLHFAASIMKAWQKCKLDKLSNKLLSPFAIFKELIRWQSLLPEFPNHQDLPSSTEGKIADGPNANFFKGCVMDIFYNDINQESIALMALCSASVKVPEQTCCGALALHAGEASLARDLACQNIEKFSHNKGPIISSGSGCTAMLKSYPELFEKDPVWRNRAVAFSSRVQDLVEYLARPDLNQLIQDIPLPDKPLYIAYHAACHLAHAQGIRVEPKNILQKFAQALNTKAGKEIVKIIPLEEEEQCCGSAGIYNLGQPDLSQKILDRKIKMIKESGANTIVTTNPGCLLQVEAGLRQQGLEVQVLHLARLLSKANLSSF